MLNVKGWSANVFKVSNNNFAGTAMFPVSFDSMLIMVVMVVSKSDADIFNWFLSISNKKLSKIGNALF
jgi:hypothetical protein